MEKTIEIYTSNYATMKHHKKEPDDWYIQISLTRPKWFKVDDNVGSTFGNNDDLEYYIDDLLDEDIDIFVNNHLNIDAYDLETNRMRIFLLCYENVKEKPCHRTLLANYLNEKYNLNIKEWKQ